MDNQELPRLLSDTLTELQNQIELVESEFSRLLQLVADHDPQEHDLHYQISRAEHGDEPNEFGYPKSSDCDLIPVFRGFPKLLPYFSMILVLYDEAHSLLAALPPTMIAESSKSMLEQWTFRLRRELAKLEPIIPACRMIGDPSLSRDVMFAFACCDGLGRTRDRWDVPQLAEFITDLDLLSDYSPGKQSRDRTDEPNGNGVPDKPYLGIRLDLDNRTVTRDGKNVIPIKLTDLQWQAFRLMLDAQGEAVPLGSFVKPRYDGSNKESTFRTMLQSLGEALFPLDLSVVGRKLATVR